MADIGISGLRVEIVGNKEVIVDGCDGVVNYDTEIISLKSGKFLIEIKGRRLNLKVLTDSLAIISGIVSSIEYSYV